MEPKKVALIDAVFTGFFLCVLCALFAAAITVNITTGDYRIWSESRGYDQHYDEIVDELVRGDIDRAIISDHDNPEPLGELIFVPREGGNND